MKESPKPRKSSMKSDGKRGIATLKEHHREKHEPVERRPEHRKKGSK